MDAALCIETLKTTFLPYIKDLQNFNFYFQNPVFWVFFMLLFLILEVGRSWSPGKAFFACVTVALILLGSTWFERFIAGAFVRSGEIFDPLVIRVLTLIIVSVAALYFILVDNS